MESGAFVHRDAVAVVAWMQRASEIIRHLHSIVDSLLRVIGFSRQRIANTDRGDAPHDGIATVGARRIRAVVVVEVALGVLGGVLDARRRVAPGSEVAGVGRADGDEAVDDGRQPIDLRAVEDVDEIRRLGIGAGRTGKEVVAERDQRLELLSREGAGRGIEEIRVLRAELLESAHANLERSHISKDDIDFLERESSDRRNRRIRRSTEAEQPLRFEEERRSRRSAGKNRAERVGIARRLDAVLGEVDLIRLVGDEGRNMTLILILI